MHRAAAAVLLLLAPVAAQTEVALPNGTGHLTVPAGWTVLSAADLAAESRPTDPAAEPARSLLLATVAALREAGRTTENLVLHMPGSAEGQLRLVNAYSAPPAVTSAQLGTDDAVARIRSAIEQELARPGATVVFHGSGEPRLFPVGGLTLTFRIDGPEGTIHHQFVIVPAGERLQYFETMFFPTDLDATTATAALLRTFDGAREPADDDLLSKAVIGGVVGAVAGVAAALLRRRRLQAHTRRDATPPGTA